MRTARNTIRRRACGLAAVLAALSVMATVTPAHAALTTSHTCQKGTTSTSVHLIATWASGDPDVSKIEIFDGQGGTRLLLIRLGHAQKAANAYDLTYNVSGVRNSVYVFDYTSSRSGVGITVTCT